jgi:hypothetical protein
VLDKTTIMKRGTGHAFTIGPADTQIVEEPGRYDEAFRHEHAIVLRDIFEPPLLRMLLDRCDTTGFRPDEADGLGEREVESPQRVGLAINLLLGRAPLLSWLEAVTGHHPLTRAEGRLVQTRANRMDQLAWHNDTDPPNRKLGVVICLCEGSFDGGIFEMRHKNSEAPFLTYKHEIAGSALVFDIDHALEHRVTPVTSGEPRRVYTGWFMQDIG